MYELLTIDSHKTAKGEEYGWLTGVMYLAPAEESGLANMCLWSTENCRRWCLKRSGRMRFKEAGKARVERTRHFLENRKGFYVDLVKAIEALVRKAKREHKKPCARPNGTSDVPWELVYPDLFQRFPGVQFYDYTKSIHRIRSFAAGRMPRNYYLLFSLSETRESQEYAKQALAAGVNVAAVFEELPARYLDHQVVDGDRCDLRFLDPRPAVVGLRPKGIRADQLWDTQGFVR